MPYDELIKRLRECTAEMNGEKTLWHQAADTIEELQKDLERSKDFEAFWQYEAEEALKKFQVAISNKPRWIPVTERLPVKTGKYLVCGQWSGKPAETWVCELIAFGKIKGWANEARNPAVSHWMPLPQPPKDGEA